MYYRISPYLTVSLILYDNDINRYAGQKRGDPNVAGDARAIQSDVGSRRNPSGYSPEKHGTLPPHGGFRRTPGSRGHFRC